MATLTDNEASFSEDDVEQLVDSVIGQLQSSDDLVETLGIGGINRLLDLLLTKAEVDLVTRQVEIEFRLPPSVLKGDADLRLVPDVACNPWRQAYTDDGILLMRYKAFWLPKFGYIGCAAAA